MAQQQTPMYMKDWATRLDTMLQLNGRELLTHAGKISHKKAVNKSGEEYEKFKQQQKVLEKEASQKEFLMNMEEKEQDPNFTGDMEALLRSEIKYDQQTAFQWIKKDLIEKMK